MSDANSFKGSMAAAAGIVILKDSRSVGAYQANEKAQHRHHRGLRAGRVEPRQRGQREHRGTVRRGPTPGRRTRKKFPQAKRYVDFRKMLDELHREIDAVVVSTPDHTHAVAAVAAMKLGKHVYCEKPLTRTVHEARVMRQTAIEQKVATQMGNQGSATEGLRRGVELAWAGTMGELREAHIWLANGDGPQERPKDEPPVPPGLHWDLWLGPAPLSPVSPGICARVVAQVAGLRQRRRRGHGLPHVEHGLSGLAAGLAVESDPAAKPAKPAIIRVEAEASEIHPETYPRASGREVRFPARGNLPPVKADLVQRRAEAAQGRPAGPYHDRLGLPGERQPRGHLHFVPVEHAAGAAAQGGVPGTSRPLAHAARSPGHHAEWIPACKGGPKPFSSFDIGGPMTEMVQLVHVASLAGKPIEYDPLAGKIVNSAEANQLLHRPYRRRLDAVSDSAEPSHQRHSQIQPCRTSLLGGLPGSAGATT